MVIHVAVIHSKISPLYHKSGADSGNRACLLTTNHACSPIQHKNGHWPATGADIYHTKLAPSHTLGHWDTGDIQRKFGGLLLGAALTEKRNGIDDNWQESCWQTWEGCVSYLHWKSAGFSAGCTCQLWVAAVAGFLCCPGHPGCFWTTGGRSGY